MAKKGMYPFGNPKTANGDIARKVQGTNGKSKPMNKVAAPSKSAPTVAMKLANKQSRAKPI
jgi:hypothetical protein